MALTCDPDYLIHSLRLNYLRHVDTDPYGPRIITFDPRYQSNNHIVASGLADSDRWPELNMPSSPPVSDDEGTSNAPNGRRMHTGFPGATGLKYTQTIMGHRAGVAGMRVSGRRIMHGREASIRRSISASSSTPRRVRAGSEPTPAATSNTNDGEGASGSPGAHDESLIQVSKRRSAGGTSLQEMPSTLIDKAELENKAEPGSVTNLPAALQGMPHIAAVQARRQRRRAHFSSGRDNGNRPIIISETKLNPEESSSDEEAGNSSGSLTDDDDYVVEVEGSLDAENDGFDPDFAPPRIALNSDSSEFLNSASNSALSTSISSAYNSLQIGGSARGKGKLSPVSETRPYEHSSGPSNAPDSSVDGTASEVTTRRDTGSHIDDYFEIVKPPAPAVRLSGHLRRANEEMSSNKRLSSDKSALPPSEELVFTRRKVPPARSVSSGLTTKLAASDTSSNPFTELYALISGRAEVASMEVTVFFPHATKPVNKPLRLTVRKDATIEEVIGFSLWSYWEECWLPKLDEGVPEDRKKERLSAVGWILRIAEDDGEVDEDFPAPDRMGKISKFNFDAYAILEANTGQAAQNAQLEAKIVRRPSRIIVSKNPSAGLAPPAPSLLGPSVSTTPASALGTSVGMLGSSLNISSSHGSQVLLRIRMANADEKATHYMTTISVYSTMYMQEVLEHICRKRRIENPKEWALLSDDQKILVPLDRTVASLEGNSHLVLIQRVHLPGLGFAIDGDKRTTRSIDPNASIFKGVSETHPKGKGVEPAFDVYKRYTVFRKVPMLVARMERTLAIDGDYIHIMPSANKARGVFDSGKTVSYHIKSVVNCSQSGKGSTTFKIIFRRDGGDKRYDFEAESARLATDIVSTVRGMRVKRGLERSSTVHKIRRRSRQVT